MKNNRSIRGSIFIEVYEQRRWMTDAKYSQPYITQVPEVHEISLERPDVRIQGNASDVYAKFSRHL